MATTEMNCLASGGGSGKLTSFTKVLSDSSATLSDISAGDMIVVARATNVSLTMTNVEIIEQRTDFYGVYVDVLRATGVPVATGMGGTGYLVFENVEADI